MSEQEYEEQYEERLRARMVSDWFATVEKFTRGDGDDEFAVRWANNLMAAHLAGVVSAEEEMAAPDYPQGARITDAQRVQHQAAAARAFVAAWEQTRDPLSRVTGEDSTRTATVEDTDAEAEVDS